MRQIILFLLSTFFIAASGFFGFFFGACLSSFIKGDDSDGTAIFVFLGLEIIALLLCFNTLMAAFRAKLRNFTPLILFIIACGFGGYVYDQIRIPEGFKILGLGGGLTVVGWLSARQIFRRLGKI
jgi:hypothetical protein